MDWSFNRCSAVLLADPCRPLCPWLCNVPTLMCVLQPLLESYGAVYGAVLFLSPNYCLYVTLWNLYLASPALPSLQPPSSTWQQLPGELCWISWKVKQGDVLCLLPPPAAKGRNLWCPLYDMLGPAASPWSTFHKKKYIPTELLLSAILLLHEREIHGLKSIQCR